MSVTATIDLLYRYTRQNEGELERLLRNVSEITGLPETIIRSQNRKREYVEARQLYIAAALALYRDKSLTKIGTVIMRDHATVTYHRDDFMEKLTLKDEMSRRTVEKFHRLIQQ